MYIENGGLPPHGDEVYLAELAAKTADQEGAQGNLLLAEQALGLLAHAGSCDQAAYDYVRGVRDDLHGRWQRGELLRWLDTPAEDEAGMHDDRDRLAARLWRNLGWAEDMQAGEGHAAFVTVPAFNEAQELPFLFGSLKHPARYPVIAIVVSDNNSRDRTAAVIREHGGNLVPVAIQGIGPAREGANEHARRFMTLPPERMVFMGTDADATYSPGYVNTVMDQFTQPGNEEKLVANGLVKYRFYWPDRPTSPLGSHDGIRLTQQDIDTIASHTDPATGLVTIDDFASYALITRTRTFRQCFRELGYDIRDFIRGRSCRMLPGPNTAFRGSLHSYHLPLDRRWEQHHVSLMLQAEHDFDDIGVTIGDPGNTQAGVTSSARAIIDPESYRPGHHGTFSLGRFQHIQQHGIIPFHSSNGQMPEIASISLTIQDMHRRTYDLDESQTVDGYYSAMSAAADHAETCTHHKSHRTVEAVHAGTRQPLGKLALIGNP